METDSWLENAGNGLMGTQVTEIENVVDNFDFAVMPWFMFL